MSVLDLLSKFSREGDFSGEIKITRFKPGEYTGGNYTATVDSEFFATASVQPVKKEDLILEDKQFSRNTNTIKIYTEVKILIDKQTGDILQNADLIDVDGIIYEAFDVQDWNFLGHQHYKTLAMEKNT